MSFCKFKNCDVLLLFIQILEILNIYYFPISPSVVVKNRKNYKLIYNSVFYKLHFCLSLNFEKILLYLTFQIIKKRINVWIFATRCSLRIHQRIWKRGNTISTEIFYTNLYYMKPIRAVSIASVCNPIPRSDRYACIPNKVKYACGVSKITGMRSHRVANLVSSFVFTWSLPARVQIRDRKRWRSE